MMRVETLERVRASPELTKGDARDAGRTALSGLLIYDGVAKTMRAFGTASVEGHNNPHGDKRVMVAIYPARPSENVDLLIMTTGEEGGEAQSYKITSVYETDLKPGGPHYRERNGRQQLITPHHREFQRTVMWLEGYRDFDGTIYKVGAKIEVWESGKIALFGMGANGQIVVNNNSTGLSQEQLQQSA